MVNKKKSFSTASERDGQGSAPEAEDPTPGAAPTAAPLAPPGSGVRLDSLGWDECPRCGSYPHAPSFECPGSSEAREGSGATFTPKPSTMAPEVNSVVSGSEATPSSSTFPCTPRVQSYLRKRDECSPLPPIPHYEASPSIFFGYGSSGEFRPYGRENEHGYWSLLVPSVPFELASPWNTPCYDDGRGSQWDILSVGSFPSEEKAIQWAKEHLRGNPYLVRFYSLA